MSESYIEENIWMFQKTYIGGGQDNQEYFGGWMNQVEPLKKLQVRGFKVGVRVIGAKDGQKPWNGPKTL